MTLDFFFLLFLILANGILAMSEIAVVSVRKTRLQQLANEGNKRAQSVLDLTNNPSRFLSTVQVGITLVGIMAGAFGGARFTDLLAGWLVQFEPIARHSHAVAFAIVVLIITYLTLILGELVPKQIALHNPEKTAGALTPSMMRLAQIARPAVAILSWSTDAVLHLFGINKVEEQPVSEEEIKVMIDQGIEAGMFEEAERDMIESVFSLADKRAGALMTPRTDVVWLSTQDAAEETYKKILDSEHSRFPVCDGSLDEVIGVVRAKDLLENTISNREVDLRKHMQQALYVPESAMALNVLETFKKQRQHIAVVVDEYGVMQGIVTIFDILEAIVGDIPSMDETDERPGVQKRLDGSYLIDGLYYMEEFKELFEIEEDLPEESSYQTLGGFVLLHLGRIPVATDFFEWSKWRFEVMDMDGTRVDKVLVTPLIKEEQGTAGTESQQLNNPKEG
ncbi:MAG TPA: hemolysin family protein [bacterium]|nr:hemolysin family protein [bacterium]HOC89274.1 hemolysin family protein [bacterium]